MLRSVRQFGQRIGSHELSCVGTHRTIGDMTSELGVVLGLADIGEIFIGKLRVLRAFRNADHVIFEDLTVPDDLERL